MNKAAKTALIIAAVLIALGILCCMASFAAAGWNLHEYETQSETYIQKSCEYDTDTVASLVFTDISRDIEITRSNDDKIHITYYESQKVSYSFEHTEDGTLTVTYYSSRKWYDYIGISFRFSDIKTVIAVPDGFSGNISVKLSSGDLRITGFTLDGSLTAESTSGDVQMSDFTCTGDIKIRQTSGDFEGQALSAASLSIKHTSGDIELGRLETEALSLTSVSGDIEVEAGRILSDCILHSTSGELSLSDTQIGGRLTCESTSGDIAAERISTEEAFLSSTSGDIHATLLGSFSDYHVDAKTTSGRIRIPENGNGARTIQVKTTSGNISVYFR